MYHKWGGIMKNYWLQRKYKGSPQDDERSIQCYDGGSANLDIFYTCQFIQNETVNVWSSDGNKVGHEATEHTPVLPGTITGTISYGYKAVQTFFTKEDGSFVLNPIGTPVNYVECGTINHITGEILTEWNVPPSEKITLVICYEFNMEPNE